MLLSKECLSKDVCYYEDVNDIKNDNPPSKEVEDSRISDKLKNTIDNSFDNMPD